MDEILSTQFIIAGIVGALGNQLLYWGNILKSPQRRPKSWPKDKIPFYMIPFSLLYIITGAGVANFVGLELNSAVIAMSSGAVWPQTIKWLNDAKLLTQAVRVKLGLQENINQGGNG